VRLYDVERINSYVLKGPGSESRWTWLGAVSDDGYGRFWITTAEGQRAAGSHRFALALVFGGLDSIERSTALHHCDIPLCVEATSDPEAHLTLGTRSDNMLDRAMKGRLSSVTALRWRRLTRAERAAQSRALRDELTQRGWDHDVIRELVHGIDHPSRSVLTRREDDGGD